MGAVLLVVFLVVVGIPFLIIASIVNAVRGKRAAKEESLRVANVIALTCDHFNQTNRSRVIAIPAVNFLSMKRGEFPIVSGVARLYAFRAHRQSIGANVRVMKGLWINNRHYLSTQLLTRIASGEIALTNQRLFFTGIEKTITLRISDIVGMQGDANRLVISSDKYAAPIILETPLAIMIRFWITILQNTPLETPRLPPGMIIDVNPEFPDGANISIKFARP